MIVLVCGSRNWDDLPIIQHLLSFLGPTDTLVSGAARGADTLAAFAATELGATLEEYPADWSHGLSAGPIRNQEMIDKGLPDLALAFGSGKGTDDMVRRCVKARVPTYRVFREG